ncbi:hypothetical protein AMJ86_06865, partial [bacterium SM23_57]
TNTSLPAANAPHAGNNATMGIVWATSTGGTSWTSSLSSDHPLRAWVISGEPIAPCNFITQINPDVNDPGIDILYFGDGTIWQRQDFHPDLPPYPYDVAYRNSLVHTVITELQCYLVFISNSFDEHGNPIPGITGQPYAWININNWHPNSTRGIAFDPCDDTFWMGDWNTHSLYHVEIDPETWTSTMVGSWNNNDFGLPDMAIAGLEIDSDENRLWAITNDDPDEWLLFDISNPLTPLLLFGPVPVPWQTGGGARCGAGLEYNELMDIIFAVNQNTNTLETYTDVGNTLPTPILNGNCALAQNLFSWGIGVTDGPGPIDEYGFTYGTSETIDIANYATGGPFPLNWYETPVESPCSYILWHLEDWWKNCPNGRAPESEWVGGIWRPKKACWYVGSCVNIRLYQAHAKFKRYKKNETKTVSATDTDEDTIHVGSWTPVGSGPGAYHDFHGTDCFGDVIEYGFPIEDHSGLEGIFARAAPSANTDTNTYARYSMEDNTQDGYTIVQNHPYSAVHVNVENMVGVPVETQLQPSEGIAYNNMGSYFLTGVTLFVDQYSTPFGGTSGQATTVDFVLSNPTSSAATMNLNVSDMFDTAHNPWISYPANVALNPSEVQIISVNVQIPSSVYDDIVALRATATNPSVGIPVMAPASVTVVTILINVSGNDVVISWAQELAGTGFKYNIYKAESPTTTPVLIDTTTSNTYTDINALSDTKAFYHITVQDDPRYHTSTLSTFYPTYPIIQLDQATTSRMRGRIRHALINNRHSSIVNMP